MTAAAELERSLPITGILARSQPVPLEVGTIPEPLLF